jgi:hypothetical protein
VYSSIKTLLLYSRAHACPKQHSSLLDPGLFGTAILPFFYNMLNY